MFFGEKNIYFETFYDFSNNNLDCHLIVLVDETWYYAVGSAYICDGIGFEFYVEKSFFSELLKNDIDLLKTNLEIFKKEMDRIIQTVENPNSIKRITLEKTFSSIFS